MYAIRSYYGVFDYWTVQAEERPEIEQYCGDWLRKNLRGYSGAVNIETIGGRIIEVHLRFADQWPDLYGEGWLEAIVELYRRHRWQFADDDRRDGYSVVLRITSYNVCYTKLLRGGPAARLRGVYPRRAVADPAGSTGHAEIAPQPRPQGAN